MTNEPKSRVPSNPTRSPERIRRAVTLLKLASNPSRMAILLVLADGAKGLADVYAAAGGSQSAVNPQLALLRNGGLVAAVRRGNNTSYGLTDRGHAVLRGVRTLVDSPHFQWS